MICYDILTPFLWRSPHKCPIVGVPDKFAKVLTSLPTSPLLLQSSHDKVLFADRDPQQTFYFLSSALTFNFSSSLSHSMYKW